MKHAIAISAVAVLALAACDKKTGTDSTVNVTIGPRPAASAPAQVAQAAAPAQEAATPPARKPGLWEQKISSDETQLVTRMCLDAATDAKVKWWRSRTSGRSGCAQETVTPHLGGGWQFHSVCSMGESGTVTSDGSATGDFSTHYKVEATAVTSGSAMPQANGAHRMSIEATWQGPCPADMKPGDMVMPGGMKINALNPTAGGPAGMGAGGHMTSADIAKMRAQAMAMAKSMHEQEK
jgi:hypothetical protein